MLQNILIYLAICSLLTSCSTVVEHARIEIYDDLTSMIQVLVVESFKEGANESEKPTMKGVDEKARKCGASTKIFEAGNKVFLQANLHLKSRDEIDVAVNCATTDSTQPHLSISTTDTLLNKIYAVNFEMRSKPTLGKSFPEEITFTVPGKITGVQNTSSMIVYDVSQSMSGDNRVTLRIKESAEKSKEISRKWCGNENNCNIDQIKDKDFSSPTLRLSIQSEKAKYDLQTIFGVLGILFGSGVLVKILEKLFSRKSS
jgi:hypothetical protein